MVQQQEQQPPSALSKLEMAQQHVKFSESQCDSLFRFKNIDG